MIKAIDTLYEKTLFRSRLEARWAVYFDELNTSWEYEVEGFELGNGLRYLPDFYLPKYSIYAEVKPKSFTWDEHQKCRRLANLSRKTVIELVGLPSTRTCDIIVPYSYYVCSKCGRKENFILGDDIKNCDCKSKMVTVNSILENRAVLLLYSPNTSFTPLYYIEGSDCWTNDSVIEDAILKATTARFEFNYKN